MKHYNVGIQMYSVRDLLAADFVGTLRAVKNIGYDYVEFAGNYGGYTGAQLKKLLDDNGLASVSVHQNIDLFLQNGLKQFDFFAAYGVKYVAIPWYESSQLPGSDAWERTKESFMHVGEMAKECGMELLYHNHDFEFVKLDTDYKYDIMFRELQGYVNPQPDVCWICYGGADPAAYIRKYADRIHVVHLKDFSCNKLGGGPVYALIGQEQSREESLESNNFHFRPLGDGQNDMKAILAACEETLAEYLIVEQDDFTDIDPLAAMKKSRDYLKENFGL